MNPLLLLFGWLLLKPKKKKGKPGPKGLISSSAKKTWIEVFSKKQFADMYSLGVEAKRNIKGTSIPSEHWCGNAIDFAGTIKQMATLQNYLERHAQRLKINYVIHNAEVSYKGGTRKKYTGSDSHTSHVHVDFFPKCI